MQNLNNQKIMIAEDDPISRKMLSRLIGEFWKGELLIAKDGQEAWEIQQAEVPSLVIIDWMMPKMDGLEVCRMIRQASFDQYIYIILLTAKDDQSDVIEGLEAGADDYIRKPFNPLELQLRIKAALRVIYLEKQLASKNTELLKLNDQLSELARIDPLMQIPNRRWFYEIIERTQNRLNRYGTSYGLLMCDIDFFKQYNDTLGHQAGDVILKSVADSIKNSLRQTDEVFRYGGEEIVVLLPSQSIEGSIQSAERLCHAVYELGLFHPRGIDERVTISVGVSSCCKENSSMNWKEILEQADQALYLAKKSGRNRAKVWEKSSAVLSG
jgi:diguanylate cyclase (GGDEF)-like protein